MLKYILIAILLLPLSLSGNTFEVIEQSEDGLTVKFSLPDYKIEQVTIDGKTRNKITCPGAELSAEAFKPSLPAFSECIGLPVDGNFNITVLNKKQKTVSTIPIIQIQDSYFERPIRNSTQRKKSEYYPESILKKGNPAYLGNRYFSAFSVFPFQYNNKKKQLLITSEITFRIALSGNKKISRNASFNNNYIDDVGDDFHILVGMGREACARCNAVMVHHPQVPESHVLRILIA